MKPVHTMTVHAGSLLLVILSALLSSCGQEAAMPKAAVVAFEKNDDAVRFVRSVRESLSQQSRPSSGDVQRLKSIAGQYPDESFIEEVLVSILPALSDWDGLASYYEAKSELTEQNRITLTRVYIKQGNYAGAREAIRPIASAQPQHVEANALLGRAHYFFGEYAEAKEVYDRVWDSIVVEQRLGDITYRAMIHFDEGNPARASEILEAGLKVSPNSIALHNALGRVLFAEGKDAQAIVHRDRVGELQDELSRAETGQMLRAARIFALNRALKSGDMDECQRLIFEFLPKSDAEFQQQLYQFLESMYRTAGRAEEIPAVLSRARQIARKD
ncbi:MAG: tetratricopeptide (TPR) repeat protein [Candidatus Paceibacteria bacterium]|jgi:tetratricopeptide (TPR) repeat protein